jgi:hypothetical protein
MQIVCGTLILGLAAIHIKSEARQDQLFTSWQKAQRTTKSLVVEFTQETREKVSKRVKEKFEGVFRLIRTPDAKVFASYKLTLPKRNDWPSQWSALLNDGTVYLLFEDEKTASRMGPTDGDLREFLVKYFNPFVLLTDKKYAKDKCYLQVIKQDESYTYMKVTPKKLTCYFDSFHEGQVVLMNSSFEGLPKDMPRKLGYNDGFIDYVFEIKSWKFNLPDAPILEEFAKPEDRAGWKVDNGRFISKKDAGQ